MKMRLTFLLAEKNTADSRDGRVGLKWPGADHHSLTLVCSALRLAGQLRTLVALFPSLKWRGAEPLKAKAFRKGLAPCSQLQNAHRALFVIR